MSKHGALREFRLVSNLLQHRLHLGQYITGRPQFSQSRLSQQHHSNLAFVIMSTSAGDVAGAPVKAGKVKMTKNQMKRAKKKENRARERASREGSVVTESESESSEVSGLLLLKFSPFGG